MRKFLMAMMMALLAAGSSYADTTVVGGTTGVYTASDCDVATYYSLGTLCQDTDDGKLYKGTGAAVEEITGAPAVADTTDTSTWVLLSNDQTATTLAPKTDAGLTYNADTHVLTATGFSGPLTGNVTGTVSGNAGTVTIADAAGDETTFPLLGTAATGSLAPATDAGLTYNANTNVLTAGGLVSGANITAGTTTVAGTIRIYDGSDHYADITTPALSGNISLVTPSASATLMANPMTTAGDIIYGGADGVPTRMAGTTPNSILSVNNAGTLGFNTAISIDDSAAQFYSATASKGTLKVLLSGSTDGKLMTIASSQTDNRTLTLPDTTGTLAVVKAEKIASFAWDGGGSAVATANSKRCVLIPVAYTVTGYNMVVDQDPGAGTTILNLDKDAIGDGTALATTDMDGAAHGYPPTVPDNKVAVNDTTITGWTTSVAANDMICATVATNAVATWISLSIYGTK